MDIKKMFEEKMMSIEEAAKLIRSNDRIWIGWYTCLPYPLADAICDRKDELENVDMVSALMAKPVKCMESKEYAGRINFHSIFTGPWERKFSGKGNVHLNSVNFSRSNLALRDHYKVNVMAVEGTEPDEEGYVYLGPQGASWGGEVAEYAERIIICVNKFQTKVKGTKHRVHIDKVTAFCREDHPLYELKQPPVGELDKKIASYILPLIPDGATIQVGLGGIANAVGYGLESKKNMRVHTEMLTDSLVRLAKAGAVNQGLLAGFGFGSQEVYDYIAEGKCEVGAINDINYPPRAAQYDNFMSINSCLMVDLTGQVGSESIGFRQFSSTGGQLDFVLAANYSKGGKSFLCLGSTIKDKEGNLQSTITLKLPPGQAVTTPRSLVMYVVTEYGAVDISNKPMDVRAELLISIAHPDFREQLRKEAMEVGIIPK